MSKTSRLRTLPTRLALASQDAAAVLMAAFALLIPALKRPAVLVQLRQQMTTPGALPTALAAVHGDKVAVIDDTQHWTYRDIASATNQLANMLSSAGSARSQCTLGLLCRNSGWLLVTMHAAAVAGYSSVLLSTDLGRQQLIQLIERDGIDAIVYDFDYQDLLEGVEPPLGKYIAWHPSGGEMPANSLVRVLDDVPDTAPFASTRTARTIMLTSGSSGLPKPVARSLRQSPVVALGALQKIPVRRKDRVLVCAPVFHGWGMLQVAVAHLVGATVIFRRRFDAEQTLLALRDERCTALVAVPTMLKRIASLPNASIMLRQNQLRIVASGGAALDRSVVMDVQRLFGSVLYNLYGSTETAFISIATPRDLKAAPHTSGRVPVGVRLRIRDGDGRPVPNGEAGEIYVSTPSMITHYADGTAKRLIGTTVATGDLGHIDAVGRLFIEGRADRMVVCGGENVYPEEVETVLCTHAGISDAAVLPVPDAEFGQRLRAFLVAAKSEPVPEAELRAFIANRLSRAKVPREFHWVTEIPRSVMGKVAATTITDLASDCSEAADGCDRLIT